MAAAVIATLPDVDSRREWIAGRATYKYLCDIRSTQRARPWQAIRGAAMRWLSRKPAHFIPDLANDYLFELPSSLPLPVPSESASNAPALVIVGTRLLFEPQESGQQRGTRHLFAQVAFCCPRNAAMLSGMPAPAADSRWSCGAVAPQLETNSALPLSEAVRVSIADMFYFQNHVHAGTHYTGGVIDLFPIELAHSLAHEVIMERKAQFNRWFALPALRTVLGIDGAVRLSYVHAQRADTWFDTSDALHALDNQGIGKRIAWDCNRICLDVPSTHAAYAALVRAQWDYGYSRAMASFAAAASLPTGHWGVRT